MLAGLLSSLLSAGPVAGTTGTVVATAGITEAGIPGPDPGRAVEIVAADERPARLVAITEAGPSRLRGHDREQVHRSRPGGRTGRSACAPPVWSCAGGRS